MIDARLAGEAQPVPRIFGRPFEIRQGRGLLPAQLEQRLNDVGYAKRPKPTQPGEFSTTGNTIVLITRETDPPGRVIRVDMTGGSASTVRRILEGSNRSIESVTLEAPLIAAIAPGQKKRKVPLAVIPEHLKQAVLAIEDRRLLRRSPSKSSRTRFSRPTRRCAASCRSSSWRWCWIRASRRTRSSSCT
jgi:transcription-repair coupling factor (superfamily II helicase)